MQSHLVCKGAPFPLGVTPGKGGLNFSLRAPKAEKARLIIYPCDHHIPLHTLTLHPKAHNTEGIWHIQVSELPPSFDYSWFLEGPQDKENPFDLKRPLIDPYALALNSPLQWNKHQRSSLKARYFRPEPFDWQGVSRPEIPYEDLIIYEMHVRGFTAHPSSLTKYPGSYLGIVEKIPYLLELGINAIELMPIHEFDETSYHGVDPLCHHQLCNYWGYSTVNFFSPMKRFACSENAIHEFKMMVRQLHLSGIEVILDVVYNHTAESAAHIFSFKGIDNPVYYHLDAEGNDCNFSGTGNTFACNTTEGIELILHSLRYFATEMQIDGFRFDLASILTRGEGGASLNPSPLLQAIANDPDLSACKLIAEGWDAAGLYQLGCFPNWGPWTEWNGRYRDSVRRFIKGTDDCVRAFATALCGSDDLYREFEDGPLCSINFVTCHDGLSLYDLVSYQKKHNLRNGEDNRDGTDNNESWNCGIEGPTDDSEVVQLRQSQMRNFHLALMLSLGVPMLLMGDEYGHTRQGNNNTWCQDNELNWFDWGALEKNHAWFRFFKQLIAWRKKQHFLKRKTFMTSQDIVWHGLQPQQPEWDEKSRFIAASIHGADGTPKLYFAFNANFSASTLILPPLENDQKWSRIVDTSLPPPDDFSENPIPLENGEYTLPSHAALLLSC